MAGPIEEQIASGIVITCIIVIILAVFTMLFFLLFLKKKRKMQREKEQLQISFDKAILQSQLEIQEQTFLSVSQEIHDNVGQILSLAKVQLNLMEEQSAEKNPLLNHVSENISKAMTDLRDLAKGLNSERIRVLGLFPAVEQEVQRINRAGILNIQLSTTGTEEKTDGSRELILFRVVQECLQNIIKHAQASQVSINFSFQPASAEVVITDNGKGFNYTEALKVSSGLGLRNIHNRMELIGGTVQFDSQDKQGTRIQLYMPYV
jgi:two-component system NarL family sensor kinase